MIATWVLRALILVALWLTFVATRARAGRRAAALGVLAVTAGSSVALDLWSGPTAGAAVSMTIAAAVLAGWPSVARRYPSPIAGVWLALIVVAATLGTRLFLEGPAAVTMSGSIVDALWSSRHGLFATSPILYLGAIGLLPLWGRDRRLAVAGALTLVLLAACTVTAPDESDRPGASQLAAAVPALGLGLTTLLVWMTDAIRRHPTATAVALVCPLVVWNITLMAVAQAGGVYGIGEPVSFADLGAAQARVLHGWIGHPASWPANLLWGAENRISPARFDLLEPDRMLAPHGLEAIDVGDDDGAWIGPGWYDREHDGDRTFRWAGASATVLLPFDHAADVTVRLTARPFDANGLAPQVLTLVVNGQRQAPAVLAPGWQDLEIRVPGSAWRAGVNTVELAFDRATRPVEVGGGADGRPLAAAVDRITVIERAVGDSTR